MDSINEIIASLEENPPEVFLEVTTILLNIISNILSDQNNLTLRSLSLNNDIFNKLLVACGAMECLFQIGFIEDGDKLRLPNEQSLDPMRQMHKQIIEKRKLYLRRNLQTVPKKEVKSATVQQLNPNNELLIDIKRRIKFALNYHNPSLLQEAKNVIPLEVLKSNATKRVEELKSLETENGDNKTDDINYNDCFIYELLKWFKQTFFTWVDKPPCNFCHGNTRTHSQDLRDGLRVEIYICDNCLKTTEFIRYNDPSILLKTRRGRCGEWANVFTLICCALGWDSRVVFGSDHCWTEIYLDTKKRWVHLDPCEMAYDTPLMYEVGWKQELTYVFAYSPNEVQDVTWRYSKNHKITLSRRKECDETLLALNLVELRAQLQRNLPESKRNYLQKRTLEELIQMLQENKVSEGDTQERQSGSLLWRIQRGEASVNADLNKQYKWKPNKLKNNWLHVRYSPVANSYEQVDQDDQTILVKLDGWQNGTFKTKSLFMKEEHDWKVVYLARIENNDEGSVTWCFSSADEKVVIDTIEVKFFYQTFENGEVILTLSNGNNSVISRIPKDSTSHFTREFSDCHEVYLTATLKGGKGDVAWQHAQLFRQSLDNREFYPFCVQIKFKPTELL
ncbi:peptide-N(4)-(N-acetyl-beta-glucosaminyl)asparagine amidase [Chrysoperla carnea]|uniref:peptide-N(4)-(N-acetyl-beta- glucosaminyl)asparagine amidase n=1 Tax=Chrysoperla carnea TaxID=189513 RepID=UPI001D066F02|nr:peptide-N(4)-(N-acetyl-beta-glucosaminyl)asparagine amidase [Chrysoperla carnea]